MKTVALIPLRGGSKSISNKNIKILAGKPLCAWVLEAAVHANGIDEVYVSTDSEEIHNVVADLGLYVRVIKRPVEFATDEASTESVMLHFMNQVSFDRIITIQATSPLLKSKHLDDAIAMFEKKDWDSLLSAVRIKRFFWDDNGKPLNYNPMYRPLRQDFNGTLMENGAFYITKYKILKELQCRLGGNIGIYEMPEDTAVEIDEPSDWNVVAELINRRSRLK